MNVRRFVVSALALSYLAAAPVGAQPPSVVVSKAAQTGQWLAVLTLSRPRLFEPANWSDTEKQTGQAHFDYLKGLAEQGVVLHAGQTVDDTRRGLTADEMSVIIFRAQSRAEAAAIVANDPGVSSGLWHSHLITYLPILDR